MIKETVAPQEKESNPGPSCSEPRVIPTQPQYQTQELYYSKQVFVEFC